MCPVYFVNDVTGYHTIFNFPFKGKAGMGLGSTALLSPGLPPGDLGKKSNNPSATRNSHMCGNYRSQKKCPAPGPPPGYSAPCYTPRHAASLTSPLPLSVPTLSHHQPVTGTFIK